jgi:hypothetical protein
MGATAVRHLARLAGVGEVLVADRDLVRAGAVADSAGAAAGAEVRVRGVEVDVLDGDGLRRLLEPADLVLNCSGPFFRLGIPALRAALDAGTAYVDICDDPEPTRAMFELDDAAKAAGVGALVGMGASPGVSNLLARRAATRLDTVEDCYTAWPLDVPAPGQSGTPRDEGEVDGRPSAAAIHLMAQISGRIPVVDGGALVAGTPLYPVHLDYPGRGKGVGYTVGHPEPLTLRTSLGVTGRAANLMLVRRPTVPYLRQLGRDIDAGKLTLAEAARFAVHPPTDRTVRAAAASLGVRGHGKLPLFFALLHGARQGRRLAVGCEVTGLPAGMDGATAVPAALAVGQLLDQPLPPGIHAPEQVIDADRLLTELLAHSLPPADTLDDFAPVTEAEW